MVLRNQTGQIQPKSEHNLGGFNFFHDPKAMKDFKKLKQTLFRYLNENKIPFSRVSDDSMEDRAVAKFSFDLGSPACILSGPFRDGAKELTSIAHEAGHVIIHNSMNREETRNYVCTMFAANKMGVGKIAPFAQAFILEIEATASAKGLDILQNIGIGDRDLRIVKALMSRWYATYEKQCQGDVVKTAWKKIIEKKNPVFI